MAEVQKNAFMLSSPTVMVAPAFTTSVYDLTPEKHSIGMVKEVAVNVDSSMIELTNGVAQAVVASRKTNVKAAMSFTSYEFSVQNIAYSLSLAGQQPQIKRGVLTSPLAGGAATMEIASDPVPGDVASAITAVGDIPLGATLLIQRPNGESDYVFPTQATAAATGTGGGPFTIALAAPYSIPANMSFPVGSKVYVVPALPVADMNADDVFGVKIVGTLADHERPITVVFPKVKIGKGFQLAFTETDFGGMPWEMTPMLLARSEASGRLADIGTRCAGDVYIAA